MLETDPLATTTSPLANGRHAGATTSTTSPPDTEAPVAPPSSDGGSADVDLGRDSDVATRPPTQADPIAGQPEPEHDGGGEGDVVFIVEGLAFYYGKAQALRDVSMTIRRREVTALIGPSGCGKTTFLRCLNRMNDLIPGTRLDGRLDFDGAPLYGPDVQPIEIRRRIGMVFQKANPFPKSIYENVAIAPRLNKVKSNLDDLVQEALTRAALWDEVKDKLRDNAFSLSGGQQQRLCIARALAVSPEVLLMDEPCSALDPVATYRIEQLISELKNDYTIVIVTHNMQQAGRVSDRTAFFTVDLDGEGRIGTLVEMGPTKQMFTAPTDRRTEDYVTGRFG